MTDPALMLDAVGNGTARCGRCASDDGCKQTQLYPFLFLFALIIFPMLSITAPAMQATLRSVPTRLTSVAIGLQVRTTNRAQNYWHYHIIVFYICILLKNGVKNFLVVKVLKLKTSGSRIIGRTHLR